MLSTKSIFKEIRANEAAFRLLLSIAAKGETQGGWENERIAALTEDQELARKVLRHGADETKHGLMFSKLLRKAGLDSVLVPTDADYCMLLERKGMGLSHTRLRQNHALTPDEFLQYLVHSKITEERASDEVNRLLAVFADDNELASTLRIIADDEINHLSYTHEELLKLSDSGVAQRENIAQMLRIYADTEIQVYRDVSLVFVTRMARLLGWSKTKQWLLRLGVMFIYYYEKTIGWRRLATLHQPERINAMGNDTAAAQTVLE
ncbi:ferritin-like domain-containing protein [Candidatus Methylospira mobilis]|uniref:ferritin-like domain-containing protein n=1 Tax=Candidatus Methylospira mobilis TaxID=1808979 RepID=UPI0028ED1C23|nr:ferritin-like domain-containing protein [Candidatus Methylospira mobilis]WNV03406.1 ferritin-like domain-containing protein [Candidatus Methylospira mobilis]